MFAAVAAAWVLLVLAAPMVAAGAPASALTYALGALICHQRPERSFHLAGAQLPVCARCFGLYVGAVCGAIAGLLIAGRKPCATSQSDWRRNHAGLRILLLAAAVPTAFTWIVEAAGISPFGNAVRFGAALPLGVAVALTVNYVGCAQPRRTGPSRRRIRI
jgi:uncharacterized membrane protein